MKRYTITAYDTNHNELWITIGSSHVGAEARLSSDNVADVEKAYRITTGKIIDPETGRPVVRTRDPRTGKRTQGARRIAYFRTYTDGCISEIHITRHGRNAGIRNYQTRRPSDTRTARFTSSSCPPIHTGPRVVANGYGGFDLVIGEGDPHGQRSGDNHNIDRWGDPAVLIGNCHRVTLADSEGSWWGYVYQNYINWDNSPLQNATVADVHRHLIAVAEEMIDKYGADITRW
jgi:hypothetical protein